MMAIWGFALVGVVFSGAAGGLPELTDQSTEQSALAARILSESLNDRRTALVAIDRLPAEEVGPALRSALFQALRREAAAHVARYHAGRQNRPLPDLDDPEFVGALTRSVVRLHDPLAVPALVDTMGFGLAGINALAAFGGTAAGAVLDVVESDDSTHYAVEGGLVALRFMIEARTGEPLSPPVLDRIRQVAADHVTGRQYFTTLWGAIDLAAVLPDEGLRSVLRSIAGSDAAVLERGITDPDLIARTRKLAADRLAGVVPLPRPPR